MSVYGGGGLRYLFAFVTGLIFCQLILGATMRHQHAGLAIPDFPAAYGRAWPAIDAEAVARYNQGRSEVVALNLITSFQIVLQMAHRILALIILVGAGWVAWVSRRRLGWSSGLTRVASAWLGLVLLQASLGAATIWTNKAADVATAHVALGALSLMTGTTLALMSTRCSRTEAATTRPARPAAMAPEKGPAKVCA